MVNDDLDKARYHQNESEKAWGKYYEEEAQKALARSPRDFQTALRRYEEARSKFHDAHDEAGLGRIREKMKDSGVETFREAQLAERYPGKGGSISEMDQQLNSYRIAVKLYRSIGCMKEAAALESHCQTLGTHIDDTLEEACNRMR